MIGFETSYDDFDVYSWTWYRDKGYDLGNDVTTGRLKLYTVRDQRSTFNLNTIISPNSESIVTGS